MARPKSLDKRNAILDAAVEVFAERGLEASPTAEISKRAGVAEGTLFTYFKTKDDLVNGLYRDLKLELADAMMSGFPRKKSVKARIQHIWDCYVTWSAASPAQKRVLDLLKTSDRITEESREIGYAPFAEIETTAREGIENHILEDLPTEFVAATMSSLADATMMFMAMQPEKAAFYREKGFLLFWKGIAKG
ncbi:MAG: TetR/AcrR family transcriptional regulator [Cyanobacteria bacterium SZAS LIN-3]|nr:TetR/AcrR family transcriptional regulator [Cyanobacteria bacterium SZAS LIN-3]MBS2005467.1 TetR/AcrR family transcriptional regulator [Cyanobacteria bacterium SZAS TMP-1]